MSHPNLLILYVADPAASSTFYQGLLQQAATDSFPNYVAFVLTDQLSLGLWSEQAANFRSAGSGHRFEVGYMVETEAQVEQLYARWQALGVSIEQPLARAVFGLTFVALDPDGHRLRVCTRD